MTGSPGGHDAVCPSGPIPRWTTSKRSGRVAGVAAGGAAEVGGGDGHQVVAAGEAGELVGVAVGMAVGRDPLVDLPDADAVPRQIAPRRARRASAARVDPPDTASVALPCAPHRRSGAAARSTPPPTPPDRPRPDRPTNHLSSIRGFHVVRVWRATCRAPHTRMRRAPLAYACVGTDIPSSCRVPRRARWPSRSHPGRLRWLADHHGVDHHRKLLREHGTGAGRDATAWSSPACCAVSARACSSSRPRPSTVEQRCAVLSASHRGGFVTGPTAGNARRAAPDATPIRAPLLRAPRRPSAATIPASASARRP